MTAAGSRLYADVLHQRKGSLHLHPPGSDVGGTAHNQAWAWPVHGDLQAQRERGRFRPQCVVKTGTALRFSVAYRSRISLPVFSYGASQTAERFSFARRSNVIPASPVRYSVRDPGSDKRHIETMNRRAAAARGRLTIDNSLANKARNGKIIVARFCEVRGNGHTCERTYRKKGKHEKVAVCSARNRF